MAGSTKTVETGVVAAFREHESALRAFVSRLVATRDEVDDVTQEAFLRAFNAEKARRVRRPRSFLFTIARNLVLSDLGRKSHQLTESMADLDDLTVLDDCKVEAEIEAEESFAEYCRAVSRLPVQCRRVFLLRKIYGLTHREIGNRLGIAVSTVEKHLAKGVRECGEHLDRTRNLKNTL